MTQGLTPGPVDQKLQVPQSYRCTPMQDVIIIDERPRLRDWFSE